MGRFPEPGDAAPDFELDGTAGRFALSAQRGTPVVLLFYPRDGSLVCTRQLCSYRDRWAELERLDAVLVAISGQDLPSHERFAASHGLRIPLLADVGGRVARSYGVGSPILGTRRTTFVLDRGGIVRERREHPLSLSFDAVDELRRAVAAIG